MQTTLIQKVILFFLGLFLGLVVLESGLRIAGFALASMQEYENHLSLMERNSFCIMCIGESTTARQYPHFLSEILNRNSKGIKFSVIDKGVGCTNKTFILTMLE